MSNAIYYVSYKLKKDASVPDFMSAAKKLNDDFISKQNGYISWRQWRAGDTWADVVIFETMEDLESFQAKSRNPSQLAEEFYSFINLSPATTKVHVFSQEIIHGRIVK